MSCAKCKAEVPPGSAFCNKCGAPLTVPPTAPAPAPASTGKPAPPQSIPEEEIWRGRCSGKASGHLWLLWGVWLILLVFLFLHFSPEQAWIRWTFLAFAVVPALGILWSTFVEILSTRYRLTTHRLFREKGILSRKYEEVDLIRVDDVFVHQNLVQRIFNVGDVTVFAPTDASEPRLEITGIENPIEVKEKIRAQVRRRREGTLFMESL